MHIGHLAGTLVLPLLFAVALLVIGIVLGPRAGAGRTRMWVGLCILIAIELLAPLWALAIPSLVDSDIATIGAIGATYSAVLGILRIVGIGMLASAAVVGRTPQARYLDPMNPGAPPVAGHDSTAYPPAGSGSPYLSRPSDGDRT